MIALIFWFRRLWPYALALIVIGVIGGFGLRWLHRREDRIRLEQHLADRDTVIAARTDTAAARTKERRVDSVTVVQRLAMVRRDTLWRHDTVRVAGDTTTRVAIPLGVLVQHDSAFAACDRLNHSCAAEHQADLLVIGELRTSLSLARTGFAIPPPGMSWKERAGWALAGAVFGHLARR